MIVFLISVIYLQSIDNGLTSSLPTAIAIGWEGRFLYAGCWDQHTEGAGGLARLGYIYILYILLRLYL